MRLPAGGAPTDSCLVRRSQARPAGIVVGEEGQRLDAGEDRERGHDTRRAGGPTWSETLGHGSQARLQPLGEAKALDHVLVGGKSDDANRRTERLRFANLEPFVEIGPADRARGLFGDRIGHHADDAAEPFAVEGMPLLAEQDGRMPADRVDLLEDVGDQIGIDCAGFSEIKLARRGTDGDKFADDGRDFVWRRRRRA